MSWFFLGKFLIVGWIIQPNTRGFKRMGNKNIIYIATVIIIVIIASGAFIYVNYKTPNINSQKNITLVDDEGYTTNLTASSSKNRFTGASCTQIVFAVGAGSKVVGVTTLR